MVHLNMFDQCPIYYIYKLHSPLILANLYPSSSPREGVENIVYLWWSRIKKDWRGVKRWWKTIFLGGVVQFLINKERGGAGHDPLWTNNGQYFFPSSPSLGVPTQMHFSLNNIYFINLGKTSKNSITKGLSYILFIIFIVFKQTG